MYFSISPNDYERSLKEEIRGCVKYLGIPYETAMSMPIQDRRYYIMRHNEDAEGGKNKGKGENVSTINGEALNAYAKLEQEKKRNEGR